MSNEIVQLSNDDGGGRDDRGGRLGLAYDTDMIVGLLCHSQEHREQYSHRVSSQQSLTIYKLYQDSLA
jgi:hypothetical protein